MEEKTILIKGLVDEDFVQYKKPSMFIGTCFCGWKCCKDAGRPVTMCQKQSSTVILGNSFFQSFCVDGQPSVLTVSG